MIINHDFEYDGFSGRVVYKSGRDYEGKIGDKVEIQIRKFYNYTKKDIIDGVRRSFPEKNFDITETLK